MRRFLPFCLVGLVACIDSIPERVALSPEAERVEIIDEPPNADVYVVVGEVSAEAISIETEHAARAARNELRNRAASRGATFVSIDTTAARAAWDLSGRTIVTLTGTAFRPKESL